MRGKTAAVLAASVVSVGGAAGVASAAQGPPPPPKGVGGAKVQQVAAGLHTPTSFAFGAGTLFEGDGGSRRERGPPPDGGVFAIKGGNGTLIPGSPQFVAGLAWHGGALYVSGGASPGRRAPSGSCRSGAAGTARPSASARRSTPPRRSSRASTGSRSVPTAGSTWGPASDWSRPTTMARPRRRSCTHPVVQGERHGHEGVRHRDPPAVADRPSRQGSSSPFVSDLGQDKGHQPARLRAPAASG